MNNVLLHWPGGHSVDTKACRHGAPTGREGTIVCQLRFVQLSGVARTNLSPKTSDKATRGDGVALHIRPSVDLMEQFHFF